jgi:hypothetical protein
MKRYFVISLVVLATNSLRAQTTRDSVVATLNLFFTGMRNADTTMLKEALSETAVLQTISEKEGKVTVINEQVATFIGYLGKQTPGAADEQIEIGNVMIDASLASVWTPYKFYYKGKFSHCGVNSFQLVRINASWKIQYIIDTRRRTACL